jgi:hypothetical protein
MQQAKTDKTEEAKQYEAGQRYARSHVRFPMRVPIKLMMPAGVVVGETENLSAAGVFFEVAADLDEGGKVQFLLTMPASVLGTPRDVTVRCTGRVMRREMSECGRRLIAVSIDQYKVESGGIDGTSGD